MVDYDNHFENGQPQHDGPEIISPQMLSINLNSSHVRT